uniref:Adenosine deaminase domain-containing protein n=1 Tax=Astatotilapia calliptera TaxID=8154 RepID=A0AAX7SM01_ASTCA
LADCLYFVMDNDVFYRELPKVELHAHLNGSVSAQTIEKLISRKPHLNIEHSMTAIGKGQRRTLDECFEVFRVIHKLVDTEEDILMVATDVIKEFAADGVKYLELRSTPREERDTGLTKKTYIETVIKAIQKCKEEGADIDVRFLVAIDRRNGTEVALETVNLAEEFMLSSDGLVVGVDLSGDPTIPSQLDESDLLLSLPPDRIGHGTFLHPEVGGSQSLVNKVVQKKIPIELCLTSNVKGNTVPCYSKHHFKYWYELGHPTVICTDDKGVFCTDLSQEYQLAASTFGLSHEAVWKLSQQAIDCIFGPEIVKQQLQEKWNDLHPQLFK